MRAALYGRYSSEGQREASIEDQFRNCETRAEKEGWQPWVIKELNLLGDEK
jgi:DNA invertase Pin-like site-specific DNA recombinase